MKLFSVLFFAIFLLSFALGTLQGPESELLDKSKQYERKSAKGFDDESSDDDSKAGQETIEESDESDRYAKLLAEDLNFPSSGIKIVKAPDLSKDSDSKKISETLAMMLESQEKWIQKFEEELEEMNKNELPEEIQVEKTAEEIEGLLCDYLFGCAQFKDFYF